jgi:hypothetical protein
MLSPVKEGDDYALVNEDGSAKVPLTADVWKALNDPDVLMDNFQKILQSYTLETNRDWAMVLKAECPTTEDYRALRSKMRLSGL